MNFLALLQSIQVRINKVTSRSTLRAELLRLLSHRNLLGLLKMQKRR